MGDQMTPADLRETAKRLKTRVARHDYEGDCPECSDMRAGADALDALADVIEWADSVPQVERYPTFDAGWEEAALHVLELVRGETNERESNATG